LLNDKKFNLVHLVSQKNTKLPKNFLDLLNINEDMWSLFGKNVIKRPKSRPNWRSVAQLVTLILNAHFVPLLSTDPLKLFFSILDL